MLTLVHYRPSQIGDVQTERPVHGGLSRFGREVVAECNRLGIVVDCAHASLVGLLRDRGLPAAHIRQVLGANAADLLNRIGP